MCKVGFRFECMFDGRSNSNLRSWRKCFYPAPKVTSALVKLDVRKEPKLQLSDYSHFRRTIKAGFAQRRKNIKNCLLNGGFLREDVTRALSELGIDENTRGEKLSIDTFGKLSEALLGK